MNCYNTNKGDVIILIIIYELRKKFALNAVFHSYQILVYKLTRFTN